MPNPTPAKHTVQLGPTVTPQTAAELATWAELLGASTSEITRECILAGLQALTPDFVVRTMMRPEVDADAPPEVRREFAQRLPAHLAAAEKRGQSQVSRRRAYDHATRTTPPVEVPSSAKKPRGARRSAA